MRAKCSTATLGCALRWIVKRMGTATLGCASNVSATKSAQARVPVLLRAGIRLSMGATALVFVLVVSLALLPGKAALAGTTTSAPQDEKPPAGSMQNGKKLYMSYGCFECHGRQAEGTSVGGPRLGPNPISFPAFSKYIRQPTGQMPPFTAKVTSDADLADIYAFLQSLPAPPKADSIPALK
jgi:mono/diheme cytochrome c family protein